MDCISVTVNIWGNQAHDDLMVANAVVRAIAEGNLTHDNTAAQEPLNPVVMRRKIIL